MRKFMSELGMTPASRTRVEARLPGARSKFEGLLGSNKQCEDDDDEFFGS